MLLRLVALTVLFGAGIMNHSTSADEPIAAKLADLPEGITSFGAAIAGGAVYTYGGHLGQAHAYSKPDQSDRLMKLDLRSGKTWEIASIGPNLQGLALVAHRDKLIRVGGFQARNDEGDDQDLWSVADVVRFDPIKESWESLPALPAPRSSHDAVVIGDRLYVVGGWTLQGSKETEWRSEALVMDLSAQPLKWTELPEPPFTRRALALGEFRDRLVVVGGMEEKGGPTRKTAIYDPAKKSWSSGPELQGSEDMEGFGSSAFICGGNLYVSTYGGNLQRMASDGQSWQVVRKLEDARFFHRLLRIDDKHLLAIGGANMESGKFLNLTVIKP